VDGNHHEDRDILASFLDILDNLKDHGTSADGGCKEKQRILG